MRSRRDLLIDLGIELLGAGLFALFAWSVNVWFRQLGYPAWLAILLLMLVAFALMALVLFVLKTRALRLTEAEFQTLTITHQSTDTQLRELRDRFLQLREASRRIAEQLLLADQPTSLSYIARYVVTPDGLDHVETDWTVCFAHSAAGKIFYVEDWSTYPVTDVPCRCDSDAPGTTVEPVIIVDEPTYKKFALHLHPPVGPDPRMIAVRQVWLNLFKDLRETGTDYFEIAARRGLKEARLQVQIPVSMGRFKWSKNVDPRIHLSESTTGIQQTLEMVVGTPEQGEIYRADITRI